MRRGDIYFIDFDPVTGREQGGYRPAIVVSADAINRLPLVATVVPGTDAANVRTLFPSHVLVTAAESGLSLDTVFLCFQLRAIDHTRFVGTPAGRLPAGRMRDIENAIRSALDMFPGNPGPIRRSP